MLSKRHLLAGLTLSALCLSACQVKNEQAQATPVASTSPSSQQVTKTSSSQTSSSKPKAKPSTPASSTPAKSAAKPAQENKPQASASASQTSQAKPANQAVTTSPATTPPATQNQETSPVPPGAAAGPWAGGWFFYPDGQTQDSQIIITSHTQLEQGIVHLRLFDKSKGLGLYAHYYPAEVAIPFAKFTDPSDISQDRLILGNGDYLNLKQEQFQQLYRDSLLYREGVTPQQTSSTVQSVSPGQAAGNWQNQVTQNLIVINPDGTSPDSRFVISEAVPGADGILYLTVTDPQGGGGGYAHYYPAGVTIPFTEFPDPTDSSRDRLILGNGGYLGVGAEDFERLIADDLFYRQ